MATKQFCTRKMKKCLVILSCFLSKFGFSQSIPDTSNNPYSTISEIVVTSNKREVPSNRVAVPVQIIKDKTIQQAGTLRLRDILQEQTGLYLTNGFGSGVQMQGLNPDYTLILLNGEPLIGRTAGVLDLNRIGLSNIKRIEIVKGPASSLYGSEAMAGVINIITAKPAEKSAQLNARYGFGNPNTGWAFPISKNTFKQGDLNFTGNTNFGKTAVRVNLNSFYIDGISFRPYSTDRVSQPINRFTGQVSIDHPFSNKLSLSLIVRDAWDHYKQQFAVNNNGAVSTSNGKEVNHDLNINPIFKYTINPKITSTLRLYSSMFRGYQKLSFSNKPDSSYLDDFKQQFYRAENQTDFSLNQHHLTLGAGYIIDQAASTRYDNINNQKQNKIGYVFSQHEWNHKNKFILTTGIRYDHHQLFNAAVSPKFTAKYNINKNASLNFSIGRGFKAPDFRQLYLNFTNTAAGGYTVLGAIDAIKIIRQLESLGQIADIKSDFNRLSNLDPEYSTGINLGGHLTVSKSINIDMNFFRNDVSGLIDARQVATRINGSQIFSYINIKKAFTQGAEINANLAITNQLNISGGYQFLQTGDKEEILRIKNKEVYTRNADGTSRLLALSEYAGLSARSKHIANLKVNWENKKGTFVNARMLYRSGWYVTDSDGNGVYNKGDEQAKGFLNFNMATGRKIGKKTNITIGIDNLLNYQDINYLPNLQGRMIYTSINYTIK
jgi:outer membrane receptor for ferrienterochelin and colicins